MYSQKNKWKKGILLEEFIFEEVPFPSCHAATITETPQGLVAAWFGGTRERNPDVGIWVSRKVNDLWTTPTEVANGCVSDTLRQPCWNPVLYQVPGDELLLFFKIGPRPSTWQGWIIKSFDNGITWTEKEKLPEGFIGPVKNKPVLLNNENLICGSSTEGNGWKIHFEITPNFGKTWEKVGPINDGVTVNAIQPTILLYKNGDLQILCRSKNRMIMESWSKDNGISWTSVVASALPNNNSGIDAVTLDDGRQLLVYNHVKTPEGEKKGARTPLNVSVSTDGITWYAALILEDSEIGQYSYPSVIQTKDGMVHVVYTWRRERIKHVVIDPSKLELQKIIDEQWPN